MLEKFYNLGAEYKGGDEGAFTQMFKKLNHDKREKVTPNDYDNTRNIG